jgi:hypothetical protein
MRITATTKPTGFCDGWTAWNRRTDWRDLDTDPPARRRAREKGNGKREEEDT